MIFEILIYGLGLVSGVGLLFSILNKYNTPNPEKNKKYINSNSYYMVTCSNICNNSISSMVIKMFHRTCTYDILYLRSVLIYEENYSNITKSKKYTNAFTC